MVTKVAVIQKPPVMLQRDATIEGMLDSTEEAAAAGATLLVFPEVHIPGYPTWMWRLKPGGDMALTYIVQHLHGHRIDPDAKVVITTIQRLYAMLRGRQLDASEEEASAFEKWEGDRGWCCRSPTTPRSPRDLRLHHHR